MHLTTSLVLVFVFLASEIGLENKDVVFWKPSQGKVNIAFSSHLSIWQRIDPDLWTMKTDRFRMFCHPLSCGTTQFGLGIDYGLLFACVFKASIGGTVLGALNSIGYVLKHTLVDIPWIENYSPPNRASLVIFTVATIQEEFEVMNQLRKTNLAKLILSRQIESSLISSHAR
ncbi:hypothetical protein BJ878DRAFT_489145 [Calycina marina]|uniref:SRCR domain-containing protein n=1 Tax=Calycina marina TaxID=1763456 RepID=A0A9P7ZB77_9HELO|nr:hypothetical protein BJ878DRAFT_489145 [Calycina marina]